ncbi:MAG: ankyrin repeat domain-containing protein [Verrucomicrobiota bacterium]
MMTEAGTRENWLDILFRRIERAPLRAYVVSALSWVVFTGVAWKVVLPFGFVWMFGIGDGSGPIWIKLIGGSILAGTMVGWLALTGVMLVSLVLVELDRAKSLACRFGVVAATVMIAAGLSFAVWLRGRDDAVVDAIIKGDIHGYEAAAKWRQGGNLDVDLWLAARWGRYEIVQLLVTKGANPDGSGLGSSAEAARANLSNQPDGNQRVIDFLLTNSVAAKDRK